MNDEHEECFNNDIPQFTWITIDDMVDMEYAKYCESQLREAEEKGLPPF